MMHRKQGRRAKGSIMNREVDIIFLTNDKGIFEQYVAYAQRWQHEGPQMVILLVAS